MPCIVQGGHWCHITVLSGHVPTEDKSDDTEGQFYEGLRCVLNHYPKYHMKILLKISVQRWGGKIFSKCHFRMRVYIKLVMVLG